MLSECSLNLIRRQIKLWRVREFACRLVFIIVIVGIGWAFLVAASYVQADTYRDMEYDVTFKVLKYELSERFGEHTNVWVECYGGEAAQFYMLKDHHRFEIGQYYRVVFVDEVTYHWYKGYFHWGRVTLKEKITLG